MSTKLCRTRSFVAHGPRLPRPSTLSLALRPLLAVALAAPAGYTYAQAQQSSNDLEEIMVTGSRLRRDGMSTPTPVTAVTNEEMRLMAPTLLMDSLSQMPQFRDNAQSHTGSIFTSGGGSNSVNLRGIGANRTLTLLDGRRMVSSQQAGTIDIAMFPTALIDRVEVVTGGASAAYGSDAISGVTNFILNTNFEGVGGNVQGGQTARDDHSHKQAEFAYGQPIGEKGHFVASFDWYEADGVLGMANREWYTGRALFTDAASVQPRRFYGEDGRSRAITPGGLIPSGPLSPGGAIGITHFIDGQPTRLGDGTRIVGNTQVGGGGVDPGVDWTSLRPNDERHNVFGHFKYDFTDDKMGFIQVLKGEHSVETLPAPLGFAPGWSMTIFADNPYIPPELLQRMDDVVAGPGVLASFPYNRLFEQLAPSREVNDETTSVTLGFEGDIGDNLHLNAYYQYGENIEIADYSSNGLLARTDRFYRALDSARDPVTGRIVCRANLPSVNPLTPDQEGQVTRISALGQPVSADPESARLCVPFDPFATEISQEAIDYITGGVHHRQKIRQDVLDISLQTEIGGNRGRPISVGGGIAYRDESVFQDAFGNAEDPRRMQDFGTFSSFLAPTDLIPIRGMPTFIRDRGIFYTGNPNNEGPIQGGFDVWEVFGEAIVPIFGEVDLHLATRYADYEGSGGVWAGKVGGDWQLNDQVRFRATWSRDTRAGSLSERFDTQTGGTNITDPLLPNEPPYIAATTIGGNPNIRPEISETMTAGVVFQPQWAEGLSFSFDVYDITIEDAISQLGGVQIVDRCYLRGVTELCALIRRSEVGTPYINQIYNLFINVAETHTAGIDFEASYTRQVEWFGDGAERIGIRFFSNYLDEASSAFVGEQQLDRMGETSMLYDYPQRLANLSFTYGNGPFTFNVQTRYRSETVRDVTWVEGIDIEDNSVGSRAYTNMNLAYDFDWGEQNSAQLYFYVGNVFDKDPPRIPGGIGATSGYAGYGDMNRAFDTLGRTYSAGVRVRFE